MLGNRYSLCIAVSACAFGGHTHAYTSSDTPPAGVRAAAFVYGYGRGIDSTLNSRGNMETLSAPLNRSVTFDTFKENEPRLKELQTALNSIEPGLGNNLLHANLYGNVKVNESHYVGGGLYGITDRFSLGLIVPVITREVNVSFNSEVTNNAAAVQSRVGNLSQQLSDGLTQVANTKIDNDTFIDSIFIKNGYQAPKSFKKTTLGDAELESRYRYYNSKRIGLALRGRVQMPTTQHEPDITNIVDKDIGEDNWALKLASIHEYRVIREKLDLSTSVWGIWRAPQKKTMAFRRDKTQNVPNLNDPYQVETVKRQRGAQLDFSAGFNLSFFRTVLNFMGAYNYTIKQSDKIYGTRDLDYASWTDNTNTQMHGVTGGIELSSIGLFLRNKFPLPARASFSWFQPLAGKNGYYTPYGRVDVIVLF